MFLLGCLFITVAWCQRGLAQQRTDNTPAVNPLVRLLQVKGILKEEEVARINQDKKASSPADADQQLSEAASDKGCHHPSRLRPDCRHAGDDKRFKHGGVQRECGRHGQPCARQ
jgi:hypothetical protein